MYSPLLNTATLAHAGGMLLGIILVAGALGFVAGLFFERALSQRQNQDSER